MKDHANLHPVENMEVSLEYRLLIAFALIAAAGQIDDDHPDEPENERVIQNDLRSLASNLVFGEKYQLSHEFHKAVEEFRLNVMERVGETV